MLRLLGDEARLRLLRLLAAERLNVSELTAVLGLAQSGVSRHLGLLRDAGLLEESREAGYAYYRLRENGQRGHDDVWPWLRQRLETEGDPQGRADRARLGEVLRLRKERFQSDLPEQRRLMPGRSWAAWARALGHLLPAVRVADLGCGEGYLAVEAASWASRVTAVDRSAEALRTARALATRRGVRNITWRRGDLEQLPLADGSHDIALLSQALHHAGDPARALAEAARITVPGGKVLVLDLRAHDEQWVQQELGDRWMGFEDADLRKWLLGAGGEDVRVSVGARQKGDPFTVVIASATRSAGPRGRSPRRGAGAARRPDRSGSRGLET